MKLSANDGGCWFCGEDEEKEYLFFDTEFDTYYHRSCMLIELGFDNAEANIINKASSYIGREKYCVPDEVWPSRYWNKDHTDYVDLSGEIK